MAWIKPTAIVPNARLIDCGNGQYADNVIVMISDGMSGCPGGQMFRASLDQPVVRSSTAIGVNQWSHLTVTMETTKMAIYVNGSLATMFSYGFEWTPRNVNRTMCYLGKSSWNDAYLQAYLDEIKIFDYALTNSQIQIEMDDLSL